MKFKKVYIPKGTRVTVSKRQLTHDPIKKGIDLLLAIARDGRITTDEAVILKDWCMSGEFPDDVPAFKYLKIWVEDYMGDGVVEEKESDELIKLIIRILPSESKDIVRESYLSLNQDRYNESIKPTEKQLAFIRELGGKPELVEDKFVASDYIEKLLNEKGPQPSVRQRMVLRFWGIEDMNNKSISEVSYWMDNFYKEDQRRLEAWELWKYENGDNGSRDPADIAKVSLGIGHEYIERLPALNKEESKHYEISLLPFLVILLIAAAFIAYIFIYKT